MKKIIILAMLLLLILAVLITSLLASSEDYLDYYSHTKAICNETNYCQDYQISCKGDKLLLKMPITGAVAQYDSDWKDPRDETKINGFCG